MYPVELGLYLEAVGLMLSLTECWCTIPGLLTEYPLLTDRVRLHEDWKAEGSALIEFDNPISSSWVANFEESELANDFPEMYSKRLPFLKEEFRSYCQPTY